LFLKTPGVRQPTGARAGDPPGGREPKSWGGNRTNHGAEVQQTLMSVIRTSRQQDVCPIKLLTDLLRQADPAPSGMLHLPARTPIDPRGP
jgi:hypothetical protein